MLDRDEDMKYSGNRHPFRGEYKVGYTAEGKLTSIEMMLYANGGYSLDLSIPVCIHYTMSYIDNKIHH